MHITMDRYEADWPMVERGWNCHVHGEARGFPNAIEAIKTLYSEQEEPNDQWLPAFAITEGGLPVGTITDGDAVLFFNFRGDRAIEISRAFTEPDFSGFAQPKRPDVYYAGLMQYDGDTQMPAQFLVDPPNIDNTVGEQLVRAGLERSRCQKPEVRPCHLL